MTEKRCSTCKEWKLYSEFSKNKSKKDGYDYSCKNCNNENARKKYKENPEKTKERARKYREDNPEKKRETDRNYRKTNPEKCNEYKYKWLKANPEKRKEINRKYRETNYDRLREQEKEYYHANSEKRNELSRKWKKENPGKVCAYTAKRYAIKKSTTTKDPWELSEIYLFYENCPKGYQVDHIIPLAKGGRHELSNLQYLEVQLNLSKNDKHPDDWDDPRLISCRA